jgi:drug/metabolite transporter (DMT)-like permease
MVALGLVFERPVFSAMTPVGLVMFAYTAVIGMGVCYLTWFATLRRPHQRPPPWGCCSFR